MSGQRRFDGDLRRLHVARFTNENHIGILPQERAENSREIQSDVLMRLNLAQPCKVILNRIFRRGNVDVRRINFIQCAVKSGRLT